MVTLGAGMGREINLVSKVLIFIKVMEFVPHDKLERIKPSVTYKN